MIKRTDVIIHVAAVLFVIMCATFALSVVIGDVAQAIRDKPLPVIVQPEINVYPAPNDRQ